MSTMDVLACLIFVGLLLVICGTIYLLIRELFDGKEHHETDL